MPGGRPPARLGSYADALAPGLPGWGGDGPWALTHDAKRGRKDESSSQSTAWSMGCAISGTVASPAQHGGCAGGWARHSMGVGAS